MDAIPAMLKDKKTLLSGNSGVGITSVEKGGDEVWIGEKFQSNPEIAGSPRNSFRASLVLVSWR